MKFSVFTASTPDWTPQETVRTLAAQGWDGVEWRITDQDSADVPGFWAGNRATWPLTGLEESIPDIARMTRGAGLEFSGIGGYASTSSPDDVERMLAATAALDARQVRVTMPPAGDDYRVTFAQTRRHLESIVERARFHGVKALIELHHRTITASASAALRLIDGLDPAHVGVIHDLGNLVVEGAEDPRSGLQLLGDYLAHVHVKNARWVPTGETGFGGDVLWREEWTPLRDGQASVGEYFEALADVGYDGWVTVEDFSTAQPLAERLADNLSFLRAVREHVNTGRAHQGGS